MRSANSAIFAAIDVVIPFGCGFREVCLEPKVENTSNGAATRSAENVNWQVEDESATGIVRPPPALEEGLADSKSGVEG